MAAHLDLTHLRRHALPGRFTFDPARRPNRAAGEPPRPPGPPRPMLRADWHLDAGGRPVCTWSIDHGGSGAPPA